MYYKEIDFFAPAEVERAEHKPYQNVVNITEYLILANIGIKYTPIQGILLPYGLPPVYLSMSSNKSCWNEATDRL